MIHNVFYKNINEIRNAVQGFIQHINERPSIHNVFYKNINEIRNAVQGFIQHINERPSEVIQRLCEKM